MLHFKVLPESVCRAVKAQSRWSSDRTSATQVSTRNVSILMRLSSLLMNPCLVLLVL